MMLIVAKPLYVLRVVLGLIALAAISACQTWQPTALQSAGIDAPSEVPALRYWLVEASAANYLTLFPAEVTELNTDAMSKDEVMDVPALSICVRFGQKDKNRRGVIVGCHDIELTDTRGEGFGGLGVLEQHQSCGPTPLTKVENRYYVTNRSNFVYIDWGSGAAYFVPEGYVSDAVSFPDWLRSIAPGPIFDVIHPKTLAASLIHDRYLCLANHSSRWATEASNRNNYRSRRAVNDAFRDVSLTTGSAAIFSQLARGAVGLANPQRGPAFVPTTHLKELLELEAALKADGFRELIQKTHTKNSQIDCLDVEPVFLCLTREQNLIALLNDADLMPELRSSGWYDAIAYLGCFSHRSESMRRMAGSSYRENASDRFAKCDVADPHGATSDFMPNIDMDDRMALRLGDVLIESAFLLSRQDGRNAFAELAKDRVSFDDLLPSILAERTAYVEKLAR